jgi:hypothetical protein
MNKPEHPDLVATLAKIAPFTMAREESLVELARHVDTLLTAGVPGDFVECGVWRGGASFLMAELLRQAGARDRKVWLCDSFEGMPQPEPVDGPAAAIWAREPEGAHYYDNCRASLDEVQESARRLGLQDYTECVKGWFQDTLPALGERIGTIAILRIDCDWYASVLCCLDSLFDRVAEGGIVIFDDYFTFDGCAVAVHQFLGKRGLAYRLESVTGSSGCYDYHTCALLRKGDATWRETWKCHFTSAQVTADLTHRLPAGETFILVDQEELQLSLPGRRRLPFLERDGKYWGAPEDDETAIRELERLRREGAGSIVFAWPAFWWLDHYTGFARHLRSRFTCVLESSHLLMFDLRRGS